MTRQYLSFDIETAKDVPGEDFDWRPHRPLGISCAATLASDGSEPRLWFSKTADGSPGKQMSQQDARGLVGYLSKMAADGFAILTWNGLAFDFDILAEESGDAARCKECALGHVDMMFHIFCSLGFPVGLEKAAEGMGLPGKPPGMSGVKAPQLWAEGRFKDVLSYVAQDVRTALQIAQSCDKVGRFDWITRRGAKRSLPLANGWLTVQEALRIPEPDTSWMSKPMSRTEFTAWISAIH